MLLLACGSAAAQPVALVLFLTGSVFRSQRLRALESNPQPPESTGGWGLDLYSFEGVLINPLSYAYAVLVMVCFLGFLYCLVDACLVFPLSQQFFLVLV